MTSASEGKWKKLLQTIARRKLFEEISNLKDVDETINEISVGDFVLVKFLLYNTITKINEDTIIFKLPRPSVSGGTEIYDLWLDFGVNLSSYTIE